MKQKILLLGLLMGLVAANVPMVHAQTSSFGESVTNYAVSLNLEQSGVFRVAEDITYDFGGNQKHGIFRTIPLYPGGWPEFGVSAVGVMDPADNSTYPFTTNLDSGNLDIKIGNPNVLVTGTKEYLIAYNVTDAVRSFPDHDELYWNAIGTEWTVPIEQASAVVTLPANIPIGATSTYCYTGAAGSTTQGCTVNIDEKGAINVNVAGPLSPNNGLTVSVSVPKGYITNTVQQTSGSAAGGSDLGGILIFVVFAFFFIFMFVFTVINIFRSKKKRAILPKELKHAPIASYYSVPDNLPPPQIGYLENRIFDASDFTAIIIDLAIRGFLKMTYIPKEGIFGSEDYELTSLKPYDESLPPEYRPAYNLFFTGGATVRVRSVDPYLGSEMLREAGTLVAKDFDDAGYLTKSQAGIFSFLSWQKFTPQGIELMRKVLGFKMFLTLTEADRLKLMDAPKASQETFEAVLPYAIALGVEDQWVKQFESITMQLPQWMDDPRYRNGFRAGMFMASFHSFNSAMRASTVFGRSGSGAGGGVGGGGGGGGGGSW